MMRTALALLDDSPRIDAWEVAHTAGHDTGCGCGDPGRCWSWKPTRSAVVSARRALHRLAELGFVELRMENVQYRASIHYLTARKRCPDVTSNIEATHSFSGDDTPA
jgi:hypothetical protein